ncbi:DUF4262 domain-containing protein [Nocardioides mesophilus]|uniref:DUF4262 domain-containing protein n=1 Tax=Nocardioides mesophilus TaxID=433659 RepID=A0A7G9R9Q9_9ACTN|nr:DUF4262 domain-containing protein [Nocardioides mesophilus]QNN52334.1 DUF4262 domain-containing protein [Nocardioides mesophilus]
MPSKATRARMLADVRRRIDEHGWTVQAVGAQCSVPGCCSSYLSPASDDADFGYTIGLSRYRGHPELIVTGIPQLETTHPLNLMGERVRDGERFAGGDLVDDLCPCTSLVALIEVDPRKSVEYLLVANQVYRNPGGPPVRALQMVWPDQRGRFPWDWGYSLPASAQPLLGPVPEV